MPQKVYNNVEGHRVIDNERVAEDVTSICLLYTSDAADD